MQLPLLALGTAVSLARRRQPTAPLNSTMPNNLIPYEFKAPVNVTGPPEIQPVSLWAQLQHLRNKGDPSLAREFQDLHKILDMTMRTACARDNNTYFCGASYKDNITGLPKHVVGDKANVVLSTSLDNLFDAIEAMNVKIMYNHRLKLTKDQASLLRQVHREASGRADCEMAYRYDDFSPVNHWSWTSCNASVVYSHQD